MIEKVAFSFRVPDLEFPEADAPYPEEQDLCPAAVPEWVEVKALPAAALQYRASFFHGDMGRLA